MARVCSDAVSTEDSIVKHVLEEGEFGKDFCLRTENSSLLLEDVTRCRMSKRRWKITLWQRSDKVPRIGICAYKGWSHVVVMGNLSCSDSMFLRMVN
jgi:hypothetical protein